MEVVILEHKSDNYEYINQISMIENEPSPSANKLDIKIEKNKIL